jgi:hypothetical protein
VFGKYDFDITLSEDDIHIAISGKEKRKQYYRKLGDDIVEKYIHAEKGNVIICPVEPVNVPDIDISEHLMIELEKPLIIESGVKDTFFTTFPIEIGVFLKDRSDVELIDIFSKTQSKYSLYGPPESGVICRHWNSCLYSEIPDVKKFYEGILKIEIENKYYEWMEISKIVFRAFDMRLFYNEYAFMHAYLTIIKKTMGDTRFNSRKPKDMQESVDIYLAKGVEKLEKKFVMDWRFK